MASGARATGVSADELACETSGLAGDQSPHVALKANSRVQQ